jgi:hypothetical protein
VICGRQTIVMGKVFLGEYTSTYVLMYIYTYSVPFSRRLLSPPRLSLSPADLSDSAAGLIEEEQGQTPTIIMLGRVALQCGRHATRTAARQSHPWGVGVRGVVTTATTAGQWVDEPMAEAQFTRMREIIGAPSPVNLEVCRVGWYVGWWRVLGGGHASAKYMVEVSCQPVPTLRHEPIHTASGYSIV